MQFEPICSLQNLNLLFICSRNQWRSPTAENIYKNQPGICARSAGTSPNGVIRVNTKHILWADLIFAMEKKHKDIIQLKFPEETAGKKIIVLNIPDEYQYMDKYLISDLKSKVDPWLTDK